MKFSPERGEALLRRTPNEFACARRGKPHYNAFTLIELVLVVGIIIVLAGLVLSTVGYARKKGARARAETEIAALSAACENYKADNGIYPRGNATSVMTVGTPNYIATTGTDDLNARFNTDSTQKIYQDACQLSVRAASGDVNTRFSGDSW